MTAVRVEPVKARHDQGGGIDPAVVPPTRPGVPLLSLWLTVASTALWVWGAALVDPSAMSDAGLISVLGWQVFVSFGLLALAVALALAEVDRSRYLLALQSVALVVMIQGLPAVIEANAPYFTAYLHVGFVEEVVRTGTTVPGLDARFNWPGSFALGGLITSVAGVDSARTFLRWSPVIFNLAYLAPFRLIARTLTSDERVRWIALWIFVSANWVHQDYFAPQAETYFLYLVVVAVVVRWFGQPGPARPRPADGRTKGLAARIGSLRDQLSALDRTVGEEVRSDETTDRLLLRTLVIVLATVVISHQITPFAALLVLGTLAFLDRCRVRNLPLVTLVLVAGWFSVGATTWWSSHLGELVGDFGKLGGNVSSGLFSRVGGNDLRSIVLGLRIAFSAVMLAGSMLVAFKRWRRGSPPIVLLALLLPPFALAGGQSYGGEVLLRSYLFALPASSLLLAEALRSGARTRFGGRRVGLTALVLSIVLVAGVAVRFGNERFERVTDAHLAASEWVYDHAKPGSVLISPTRNVAWRYRDLTAYRYEPTDEEPLDTAAKVLSLVPEDSPAYFLTSDAQQLFGEQLAFLPDGWLDDVTRDLLASGRARLVFQRGDAAVYRLSPDPTEATS